MVLGELDSNMKKNETRPLSYTIHKNKMDKGPECETRNHQNPRGESRKEYPMEKKTVSLANVAGRAEQQHAEK